MTDSVVHLGAEKRDSIRLTIIGCMWTWSAAFLWGTGGTKFDCGEGAGNESMMLKVRCGKTARDNFRVTTANVCKKMLMQFF